MAVGTSEKGQRERRGNDVVRAGKRMACEKKSCGYVGSVSEFVFTSFGEVNSLPACPDCRTQNVRTIY